MDYGPFLSLTLAGSYDAPNRSETTTKATIFRWGEKYSPVCMAYDTELMRVASAWQNGFIDFNGIAYNGAHNVMPRPRGSTLFTTRQTPGWAIDGNFKDPRPNQRGSMPRDWLRYKGIYRSGPETVLSYSVGDADVLESPRAKKMTESGGVEFARVFNVAPTRRSLSLLVLERDYVTPQITQTGWAALGADSYLVKVPAEYLSLTIQSQDAPIGSSWVVEGGRITLKLPPLYYEARFTVRIAAAPYSRSYFTREFDPSNLHALTHGGPSLWNFPLSTQCDLSYAGGAYVVDSICGPENNPWQSWLRWSGLDFFPDGNRAAMCTWNGDVWVITGFKDKTNRLEWRRFATGLHEPLGLKIVNEKIFVTCRNQIARLHDFDGDGECDFYENFNSDFITTANYHEFTLDLDADREGNLYFCKSSAPNNGPNNYDVQTPHNGCFFKLSKDGEKLETIARGLRVPNGLSIGPNGEMRCSDNDGSWVPANCINDVKPGAFLGVPAAAWPDRPVPDKRDPPICWIPTWLDNSAAGQVWVTGGKWGPLEGKMLHLSYGKASLFTLMSETVDGQVQGGLSKLPLQFGSGIMRGRFNPGDGQLYVCGLKGWQTTGLRDGVFQRVRYTGQRANMPVDLHVKHSSIELTFSDPLNRIEAEDISNFSAYWFNVKWSSDYSSARYAPNNPRMRWEKQQSEPPGEYLPLHSVKLSADNKTIIFEVPNLRPVSSVVLRLRIKAEDGTRINQEICHTINAVPEK